jgi:hypothetical protein
MVLRAAFPTDAPALAGAYLRMMEEAGLPAPASPRLAASRLAASIVRGMEGGSQAWFVVEDEGAIVATAGAILWVSPLDDVLAARLAVTAAVDWCKKSGVKVLRLQTTDAARPLYESLGFRSGDVMTLAL